MNGQGGRTPELALPASAMRALAAALTERVGADEAAYALRAAGNAAGTALHAAFAAGIAPAADDPRESIGDLEGDAFWQRISDFLAARGWGRLRFSQLHDGVGALESDDWFEAATDARADRPSCHFSTGMLANLLGGVAGDEVAVMEAECRSTGQPRCVFLFGAPATLETLYGDLAAGTELRQALLELV
jgi:hypothetical protein